MSSAVVTMREASGDGKVTHQVARAARVDVHDGVLVLQSRQQTEEYFAAPVELVDHVELGEDPSWCGGLRVSQEVCDFTC